MRVLDTLQAWGGDETSKSLTFQVLYNLMREPDRTGDTARRNTSSHLDVVIDTDPYRNRSREDPEGYRTITRDRTYYTDWKLKHTGSNESLGPYRTNPHIITSHRVWE